MRKTLVLICLVFGLNNGYSQIDSISNYLEDQLYLTLSYDALINTPKEFEHNGFSGSFSTGFIKDIPINSERNIGFGVGLGYGYSAYIQNMRIEKNNGNFLFVTTESFTTNWLKLHKIEVPLEVRFRGSTATKYKFWRVYTGIKLSYVLASKSKFKNDDVLNEVSNIKSLEKWQYGLMFSAGYSTWNLYLYYGLNSIFKDVIINNETFKPKEFKIGLNFYIM